MICFIIVGTTKACVTRSRWTRSSHARASNCGITISLRPVQMLVMYAVVPAMW